MGCYLANCVVHPLLEKQISLKVAKCHDMTCTFQLQAFVNSYDGYKQNYPYVKDLQKKGHNPYTPYGDPSHAIY